MRSTLRTVSGRTRRAWFQRASGVASHASSAGASRSTTTSPTVSARASRRARRVSPSVAEFGVASLTPCLQVGERAHDFVRFGVVWAPCFASPLLLRPPLATAAITRLGAALRHRHRCRVALIRRRPGHRALARDPSPHGVVAQPTQARQRLPQPHPDPPGLFGSRATCTRTLTATGAPRATWRSRVRKPRRPVRRDTPSVDPLDRAIAGTRGVAWVMSPPGPRATPRGPERRGPTPRRPDARGQGSPTSQGAPSALHR